MAITNVSLSNVMKIFTSMKAEKKTGFLVFFYNKVYYSVGHNYVASQEAINKTVDETYNIVIAQFDLSKHFVNQTRDHFDDGQYLKLPKSVS